MTRAAGTDAIQTITIGGSPTASTFKLKVFNRLTAAITWSATNATLVANIDAALEALLGSGTVTTAVDTMTNGVGTITVTFTGAYAKRPIPVMTVSQNNTGGTIGVATTTPGVAATHRNAPKGTLTVDTSNGKVYRQTGTTGTWTEIDAA